MTNSNSSNDIKNITIGILIVCAVLLLFKVFQLNTARDGMHHVIDRQQQDLERANMMLDMDENERLIFDPRADNWSNLPVNPELDPRYINNR